MTKKIFILFFWWAFSGPEFFQKNFPDSVIGKWENENQTQKIEIYKQEEKYFGKIIWSNDVVEKDGKALKTDSRNPNSALRSQTIYDMIILSDFVFTNEIWENGKMYDPQSGKYYSCLLRIKEEMLEIRSFVGIPLLGRSTYWKKSN